MIEAVQRLERSVKARRDTDVVFINWWLYILVINPITFGIYNFILFFKRANRADRFIERKKTYYTSVLEFTEQYAKDHSHDDVIAQVGDLKEMVNQKFAQDIRPIRSGLSFLLIFVTFGIWFFVYYYKITKIWDKLQSFEQEFDDKLSTIWNKIGLLKYPLNFHIDPTKKRSYFLYLVLAILTFGIWALIWDYKIHTDPERLYPEFHTIEDTILQIARS